ncbi:hypothetical protein [Falsiroseomonas stagni]|uniref:hypothetical protein n=1 Tax=Falsiroseomonas stagni TaxID=484882 RepID=UPI000B891305|nr:hypothetical protein [Falsiroseomonas stagni]
MAITAVIGSARAGMKRGVVGDVEALAPGREQRGRMWAPFWPFIRPAESIMTTVRSWSSQAACRFRFSQPCGVPSGGAVDDQPIRLTGPAGQRRDDAAEHALFGPGISCH